MGGHAGYSGYVFELEDDDALDAVECASKRQKTSPNKETARIQLTPTSANVFKNLRIPREPHPANMRLWKDFSDNFQVHAEFLGLLDTSKSIALSFHKANSVRIKVPISKMSNADIMYISSLLDQPANSLIQIAEEQRNERQNERREANTITSLTPQDNRQLGRLIGLV